MLLSWKNQYYQNDCTMWAIYRFKAIPVKMPMTFYKTRTNDFKIHVKRYKRPQCTKIILKRKTELEDLSSLTSDYTPKHSHQKYDTDTETDNWSEWNRIQSPEVNSNSFGQWIYDKEARIYDRENSLFNKWCWEKLDSY